MTQVIKGSGITADCAEGVQLAHDGIGHPVERSSITLKHQALEPVCLLLQALRAILYQAAAIESGDDDRWAMS
jgi:hypothetical protein